MFRVTDSQRSDMG